MKSSTPKVRRNHILSRVFGTLTWLIMHYLLFVRDNEQDLPRWLSGGTILALIILFFLAVHQLDKRRSDAAMRRESYVLPAMVVVLGLIASWLTVTPGWSRMIGAILVGAENFFAIYEFYDQKQQWKKGISVSIFLPIVVLGLIGAIEAFSLTGNL